MAGLHGIRQLSLEAMEQLLDESAHMAEILTRPVPKVPALRGKRVGHLFFEDSTRTRMSFELAAKSLGAEVVNFSTSGSSLSKGETLLDTAQTIRALGVDCVVVRAAQVGMPAFLQRHLMLPVINAGDGTNEHPTQALLDLSVLRDVWDGRWGGRTLAIVGDVARSRVARSHLWAAQLLGHRVRVIAPKTFLEVGFASAFEFDLFHDLDAGLTGVDAVLLLRVQNERRSIGGPYLPESYDYFLRYGLSRKRLQHRAPEAVVLHPGPVNRAVEIAPDLIYDPDVSLIQRQVSAGVAVRMAVLYRALSQAPEDEPGEEESA